MGPYTIILLIIFGIIIGIMFAVFSMVALMFIFRDKVNFQVLQSPSSPHHMMIYLEGIFFNVLPIESIFEAFKMIVNSKSLLENFDDPQVITFKNIINCANIQRRPGKYVITFIVNKQQQEDNIQGIWEEKTTKMEV